MSTVSNYGELKTAVEGYLYERSDLTQMIPTFIELSERKIFRRLRCPSNESIASYQPVSGIPYDVIALPKDYLEAKVFAWDGKPLTRISEIEYLQKINRSDARGTPYEFCRIGVQLALYPKPDDDEVALDLVYWRDMSGGLNDNDDTNDILRIAPDLYVYGACLEASPYLVKDERLPVWRNLFNEGLAEINDQATQAEYSGSVVSVSGIPGGE